MTPRRFTQGETVMLVRSYSRGEPTQATIVKAGRTRCFIDANGRDAFDMDTGALIGGTGSTHIRHIDEHGAALAESAAKDALRALGVELPFTKRDPRLTATALLAAVQALLSKETT